MKGRLNSVQISSCFLVLLLGSQIVLSQDTEVGGANSPTSLVNKGNDIIRLKLAESSKEQSPQTIPQLSYGQPLRLWNPYRSYLALVSTWGPIIQAYNGRLRQIFLGRQGQSLFPQASSSLAQASSPPPTGGPLSALFRGISERDVSTSPVTIQQPLEFINPLRLFHVSQDALNQAQAVNTFGKALASGPVVQGGLGLIGNSLFGRFGLANQAQQVLVNSGRKFTENLGNGLEIISGQGLLNTPLETSSDSAKL